jgi:putative ABC transport system permease protein
MLNRDFLKWVLLAMVVAVPVAWYVMHRWMEGFAYRTGLSWWVFGLAAIIVLLIALLTVSYQSFRASTRNPVDSLRHD